MSLAQVVRPIPAHGPRDVDAIGLLVEVIGPEAAARLIERFGRLREVALADDADLRAAGLRPRKIRQLRAAFELGVRANAAVAAGARVLCAADVVRYFT